MVKITEEMEIHKNWYKEARDITPETLPEFIRKLTEDYEHDYGTICHAASAAALAAAWAVNKSSQGGITGFQAGCVMWEFVRYWQYSHNKTGMRIVDYDQFLYPQYAYKFDKTIQSSTWAAIQKAAKENIQQVGDTLDNDNPVHRHWLDIIEGHVPFGYVVAKD